jgi:endonuclease/exonuclease/phosphatase family metal-dependent hydrolase
MKRAHFLTLIALALTLCTGMIGTARAGAAPAPGNSVRVLTFNTALFSPIMMCGGLDPTCQIANSLGDHIKTRANRIADLLEPGQFDVVALNEVWDEDDGKDILTDRLSQTYPHYVNYVDVAGGGLEEDSGLMLFSTFEFEKLPDPTYTSEDNKSSYGDDSGRIAYVKFDACEDSDCHAAKGAMLVRLRHPSSGRIINVVATHLQADYGDVTYDDIRWKQMRQIRGQCETRLPTTEPSLIETTLGPSLAPGQGLCHWPNNQWLLAMGDLNIRGEGGVGTALHPATAPNQGPKEWWAQVGGTAANRPTTGYALYDAWAETTSEADMGISQGTAERLDYILASRQTAVTADTPPPDLCVQHVWIPPEFEGLSDHRPVAADLNLAAPQCNSRLAAQPSAADMGALGLTNGKEAKKFYRQIAFPGSMQWWRIDEPGTYSIAVDPNAASHGVSVELYQADNLSDPLLGDYALGKDLLLACDYTGSSEDSQAICERAEGQKFVVPKGPFYVRVFSTDRSWTGNYWIAFHKYTCKTIQEACELLPNAPAQFDFPQAGTPLNADDAAWFRAEVREQADSGQSQQLQFYIENAMNADWQEPKLTPLDSSGATELSTIDGQSLSGPSASTAPSGKPMVVIKGQNNTNQALFLRVGRNDVGAPLSVRVGWQTNLVLLGGSQVGSLPAKLVCNDETNPEMGEDEIRLEVNIDNMGWQTRGQASFECDDEPDMRNWDSAIGLVRFLDSVQIRLVELDGNSNPDDVGPAAAPQNWSIDSDITKLPTQHQLEYIWDDGDYTFYFSMGKWRAQ